MPQHGASSLQSARQETVPRADLPSYGLAAIFFHWAVAALFLVQLPLGYLAHASASDPELQFELYQWHKSVGFLILALSLLRIGWRRFDRLPVAVVNVSKVERRLAGSVHLLLYGATLLVPLTGWAIASTSPLRIPSYVFNLVVVPPLPMAVSAAAESLWSNVHAILAWTACALAGLHILAALYHHFVRRDDMLLHMLRTARAKRRGPGIWS